MTINPYLRYIKTWCDFSQVIRVVTMETKATRLQLHDIPRHFVRDRPFKFT